MAIRWPGICSQILRKSRANWTAFFNGEHFFLSLSLSLQSVYCDSFISRGCFIVYYYLTTILSRLSTVSRNYWRTFIGIGRKKGRKRNTKRCCNTLWIHERLKPVTSIDMYIDRGGTCGQSCQRFSTNKTCLEFKSYSIFLVKIPVKIKIRFVLTDRTRDREREGKERFSINNFINSFIVTMVQKIRTRDSQLRFRMIKESLFDDSSNETKERKGKKKRKTRLWKRSIRRRAGIARLFAI